MTPDPFRDYTREEQLALDLTDLFDDGLRAPDGRMRPEVQGIGMTAAALQAIEEGVPLEFVGLMLTNARENDLQTTREHPEDLTEEVDECCPKFASLIRSAVQSCRDEAEYRMLVQWIANVHQTMSAHRLAHG
jgi:hypothetical protein